MTTETLIQKIRAFADEHGADDEPFATPVEGLSIVRGRKMSSFQPVCYEPILCLVLQGAKATMIGVREVVFSQMQSLIVSLDMPATSRIVQASPERPYVAIAMTLDVAILREMAEEGVKSDGEGGQVVVSGKTDPRILDAAGRLFDLVHDPAAARILAPLIKREIHYLLLAAEHGGMLRRLAHRDSHVSRIARAIAVIRRSYDQPIRIEALADVAGMSASAFHQYFRQVTETTPLQYQKHLRLAEGRRLIVGGEANVGTAAFRVGYESPTQFSREYKRAFGRSPIDDRMGIHALT